MEGGQEIPLVADNGTTWIADLNKTSTNSSDVTRMYDCLYSDTFKNTISIGGCLIAVPTLFGNTMIIISILRFPKLFESSFFILLRNLAMAEWLIGLTMILFPLEIAVTALQDSVHFCLIRAVLFLTAFAVSGTTLMLISIDRFMAVMRPMKHLVISQKRTAFNRAVLVTWIIWLVVAAVPIYIQQFVLDPPVVFHCRNALLIPGKVIVLPSCGLIFELAFNITLYTIVIRRLRQTQLKGKRAKSKRLKTITMIAVFVAFGICWTPFIVTVLVQSTIRDQADLERITCIAEYMLIAGCFNTSMNWVIYGLANKKFRETFRILLDCCLTRRLLYSTERSSPAGTDVSGANGNSIMNNSTFNTNAITCINTDAV